AGANPARPPPKSGGSRDSRRFCWWSWRRRDYWRWWARSWVRGIFRAHNRRIAARGPGCTRTGHRPSGAEAWNNDVSVGGPGGGGITGVGGLAAGFVAFSGLTTVG